MGRGLRKEKALPRRTCVSLTLSVFFRLGPVLKTPVRPSLGWSCLPLQAGFCTVITPGAQYPAAHCPGLASYFQLRTRKAKGSVSTPAKTPRNSFQISRPGNLPLSQRHRYSRYVTSSDPGRWPDFVLWLSPNVSGRGAREPCLQGTCQAFRPSAGARPMNASGRTLVPRKQPLSPELQDVPWSPGTPRGREGTGGPVAQSLDWCGRTGHLGPCGSGVHSQEGGSCRVAGRRCDLKQDPSSKPQLPVYKARQRWLYVQPWVCSKAEFWSGGLACSRSVQACHFL